MEFTHNAYQPISLGTTIIGVVYNGGVLLGADGRTSMGSIVVNRCKNKIRMVSDSIGMCTAGTAAHSETIGDYVKHALRMYTAQTGEEPTVLAAATSIKNIIYGNKSFLSSSVVCGGYDPVNGATLYRILQSGAMKQDDICVGGSGSTYIWGYCDAHFKKNMTFEEAKQFIVTAVSLAIYRDGSSGGIIHTVNITAEGVQSEFITGDKVPVPQN
ncbi:proteasome subunit beta type 6 precursor, putative [Entamoeba histolytica HM-1:IMSS-B]|uniref:proteasome endopeptidase complex n=8 Tax=Entamoeba TaxID=5758 RepID=C4M0I9_ENTH1|nr:proteasome subunit beta type 6 precursor, putative [Entamoeba nuttalli P19]XP_650977.1 proteasome beta subunit, putative [Entamoeba histolytica HM-1:IMSS]EMD44998.1 proteasome beta subunit, putative [Entamoeba histolytica KU27]EMH75774.1 proteasome subunit beta type 6 precursor, putative [Entamoeba histolytica HM-1:IMSS-B]EMS11034.1 proteasome beta subunit, putative [Entamoeba histolytica HM-3:IMSS]ENY64999.1 proteasome beta subunit, putative [Entamoeba histolytica HM-1:IMSS-A]GAT94681.1 p|eukprot:XP_008857868.1 proteasome subunit beta type 6 precursor, putative [Entamoeba nuttalli P19]